LDWYKDENKYRIYIYIYSSHLNIQFNKLKNLLVLMVNTKIPHQNKKVKTIAAEMH